MTIIMRFFLASRPEVWDKMDTPTAQEVTHRVKHA